MADCSTTAEGAASIKQAFEKGRQREKVSAKYLKECGEERGARLRGDKAVSCTLRLLLCHWIRLLLGRLLCVSVCPCVCLHAVICALWPFERPSRCQRCRHSGVVCLSVFMVQ